MGGKEEKEGWQISRDLTQVEVPAWTFGHDMRVHLYCLHTHIILFTLSRLVVPC